MFRRHYVSCVHSILSPQRKLICQCNKSVLSRACVRSGIPCVMQTFFLFLSPKAQGTPEEEDSPDIARQEKSQKWTEHNDPGYFIYWGDWNYRKTGSCRTQVVYFTRAFVTAGLNQFLKIFFQHSMLNSNISCTKPNIRII